MLMTNQSNTFRRLRPLLLIVGLIVICALWALFRPEKLFVNQRVDEKAPAEIGNLEPLFTGSLHQVGNGKEIHGRINVLKQGGGLQVEIANLETKAVGPFTLSIAADNTSHMDTGKRARILGTLPAGATHGLLPLAADMNPVTSKTILLTDETTHQIIAEATLEEF